MWGSFLVAMSMVSGLLLLGDRGAAPGFAATQTALYAADNARDPIFDVDGSLDRSRWQSILIHHSGDPAGDAESMRRLHIGHGARNMGYHFLVGNGNGMGDGVIHVGERWIEQAPGWHAVGGNADFYNQHAIAICLIGNGDRRPFTERQTAQLIGLVRRIQQELNIPASAVRLHRDVAPRLTTSPGQHFPTALLDQQLLTSVR